MPSQERMPPHSKDAELRVLECMLRNNWCIADVLSVFERPETLYADVHQKIFRAMVDLWNDGKPADLTIIPELLKQRGQLDDVGPSFLGKLWVNAGTGRNVVHYAKIVRDKAILRALRHAGAEIQMATDGAMSADEALETAEQKILSIAQIGVEGEAKDMATVMARASDLIDKWDTAGGAGIPTGLTDLDNLLSGLKDGEMFVVGARMSTGKTAFALSIAWHVAKELDLPVLFFSFEQEDAELGVRLLSMVSRVNSYNIQRPKTLTDDNWRAINNAKDIIRTVPIHLIDRFDGTMLRIAANARRLKAQKSIRLVVIDYVGLITPENRRESRQEQVAAISRRIKALARELCVPVIALTQLNRNSDSRANKEPQLSDLRESDALGNDGDVVVLLWQDESEPGDDSSARLPEINAKVAKNRNGPRGTVRLTFHKQCMRFTNLVTDDEAIVRSNPFDRDGDPE